MICQYCILILVILQISLLNELIFFISYFDITNSDATHFLVKSLIDQDEYI